MSSLATTYSSYTLSREAIKLGIVPPMPLVEISLECHIGIVINSIDEGFPFRGTITSQLSLQVKAFLARSEIRIVCLEDLSRVGIIWHFK